LHFSTDHEIMMVATKQPRESSTKYSEWVMN
jgi:hypothetical protein